MEPDYVQPGNLYRSIVGVLTGYAVAGACVVMVGWATGAIRLTDWDGSGIVMKINAAIAAASAGLALLCVQFGGRWLWGARVLGLLTAIIGGMTFAEHITGWNLGLDMLIVAEPSGALATVAPGRMGPPASLSFFLVGIGTFLVTLNARARWLGATIGLVAGCIVGISLTGHLFGANVLFLVARYTGIAMQTATIVLALSLVVVLQVPEHGVVAILRRRDPGGMMARRMIFPLMILPLLFGWLRVQGQELGLYDTAFGTATFAFLIAVCLAAIMFRTAGRLGHAAVALEESRRKNEESLREADKRKDNFLAMLAHELRNPLAPIRNSLEILKRSHGREELAGEARATMERQLTHMVRLIDDLLDVSRISQDRLLLKKERVDLVMVLRHALETMASNLSCSSHQLNTDLPVEPIWLDADPVRLVQVFGNLLNNACKYTDPGGKIALTARRDGTEAVVIVKDNGMGIAPDMLEKIFVMFTQLNTGSKAQGGLGIGLSLARRLVELHGGTLVARSEGVGKGSEFEVRLPVAQGAEKVMQQLDGAPHETMPTPAICRRRILVVDDNQDAAKSLARLLELEGHETEVAFDGAQGVAKAATFLPEVLLLDIGLPEMSGYEACRLIRGEPWGDRVRIIALTGWGQDADRQRSKEAGFDDHLVKPVDLSVLKEKIATTD